LIRTVLSDAQWERIAPELPGKIGDLGRSGDDNRRFVEGVLWVVRTGAPWRDLPDEFGKWYTSTRASGGGGKRTCGSGFSSTCPRIQILNTSSSMRRWSGSIRMAPALMAGIYCLALIGDKGFDAGWLRANVTVITVRLREHPKHPVSTSTGYQVSSLTCRHGGSIGAVSLGLSLPARKPDHLAYYLENLKTSGVGAFVPFVLETMRFGGSPDPPLASAPTPLLPRDRRLRQRYSTDLCN
jgi:transposase